MANPKQQVKAPYWLVREYNEVTGRHIQVIPMWSRHQQTLEDFDRKEIVNAMHFAWQDDWWHEAIFKNPSAVLSYTLVSAHSDYKQPEIEIRKDDAWTFD